LIEVDTLTIGLTVMTNEAPEPFEIPPPDIEALQAADVSAPAGATSGVVSRVFSVKQPEEDAADFEIYVRASTLNRIRNNLNNISTSGFPWEELLLGFSTLLLGAWIGAVPSEINHTDTKYFWYFQAFPAMGFSALIAYIFLRKQSYSALISMAKSAHDELPDPKRAK